MSHPSKATVYLLRRCLDYQHVAVDDATRLLYRELVAAELIIPLHSFAPSNEGTYRLTEAGIDLMQARRYP